MSHKKFHVFQFLVAIYTHSRFLIYLMGLISPWCIFPFVSCLWLATAVDNPSAVRLRSCFVAQLIFSQLLFCGNVSRHSFGQFEHTSSSTEMLLLWSLRRQPTLAILCFAVLIFHQIDRCKYKYKLSCSFARSFFQFVSVTGVTADLDPPPQ